MESLDDGWYVIRGINPEPWTVPTPSLIRRGGRVIPILPKDPGLKAYQEAVAAEVERHYPNAPVLEGEVELTFWLWRQLTRYQGQRKVVQKNIADATNMQKALEDALQGVLFVNDRSVIHAETWVMGQSTAIEPCIVIHCRPLKALPAAPLRALEVHPTTTTPDTRSDEREHMNIEEIF